MKNKESFLNSNDNTSGVKKYGGHVSDTATEFEKKFEALTISAHLSKPNPRKQFCGKSGFPPNMIEKDEKELARAKSRHKDSEASNDRDALLAEPVLTLILNDNRLLTNRESFAHITSEYDDVCKGTDAVFCVKAKDDDVMTFAIDVSTGTEKDNVRGKFDTSAKHNMASDIHYCMRGKERWSAKAAPHFIVGMAPSSLRLALDKIRVGDSNIRTIGRMPDTETDFIVLSEIREQIMMQTAILKNSLDTIADQQGQPWQQEQTSNQGQLALQGRLVQLKSLLSVINGSLMDKLGIGKTLSKEEQAAELKKAYYGKVDSWKKRDDVYANIMNEATKRFKRALDEARGRKSLESAVANAKNAEEDKE